MTYDLWRYIQKILIIAKLLTLPYLFSFSQGHYYMNKSQINQINKLLYCEDQGVVHEYERKFTELIGDGYGISFAAGRMAFYSILKAQNIGAGDEVILPGFTCSVMPNAVWRTGAKPIFTDIDSETFGSSVTEIKKKITEKTKLIVAQHSFGIPCHIEDIAQLCKEKNIFLVEDCAIALDSSVSGVKVGNWGDAAIFSTDHTKPLNTLIGGFLFTRNYGLYQKILKKSSELPQLAEAHKINLFNQFKLEQKYNNPSSYSKIVFMTYYRYLLQKLSIIKQNNIFLEGDYNINSHTGSTYPYPAQIPSFLAQIGVYEIERWQYEKKRRKSLFEEYLKIMTDLGYAKYLPNAYFDSKFDISPLRFVFQHPNSKIIIQKMSEYIDISGIWFKAPVICCDDDPESLGYLKGSCQISEKIGEHIINWPCVVPEGWEAKILDNFKYVMENQ